MSLLKRFAELYLNQPMLLSAGLLPELAYPVASWRYAEVVSVPAAPAATETSPADAANDDCDEAVAA
ncbi:MAG: hypothetical protein RLZZ174_1522 [Pseudomonadota bacterium]|jgi:hypothetical protein|nr:hypothetical protein [Pseudomonadales bacterium]